MGAIKEVKILNKEHGVFRFKIVANMVRSMREGDELFSKLSKVTNRFLDVALELVAVIPFDENVRKSVRKQKALNLRFQLSLCGSSSKLKTPGGFFANL